MSLLACGAIDDETPSASDTDTATIPDTEPGTDSDSFMDTATETDSGSQPQVCRQPSYPSSCDLVTVFQCGFDGMCVDGEITIGWHEHVLCPGTSEEEQIVSFQCTYTCPYGCADTESSMVDWPHDGTELLETVCAQQPATDPSDTDTHDTE
ncbi:MAG: hypothetical protein JXR76_28620 [Deltaproteobacteria bacterium]|nr:hypothetical protein [Deltaproteobacteria bacterium]